MKNIPPEYIFSYLLPLFNFALISVVAVAAWFVKRSIAHTDASILLALRKMEAISVVVVELRLMIAGDYLPRKEHAELAQRLQHEIDLLREGTHKLRGDLQPLAMKLAVLEAATERRKDANHSKPST